jgi:hypothetical protein
MTATRSLLSAQLVYQTELLLLLLLLPTVMLDAVRTSL